MDMVNEHPDIDLRDMAKIERYARNNLENGDRVTIDLDYGSFLLEYENGELHRCERVYLRKYPRPF